MARLASIARGGYYPAPPEAIDLLLAHLAKPDGPFSLLDPCCGEGLALARLASGLSCPPGTVHAIELSDTRAVKAAGNLPGARLLAPAAFEGTTISTGSIGLMWLNPPYDDEMGGGSRVEAQFLWRATRLLCTRGVLAFCLPEYVIKGDREMQQHIMANYRDIGLLRFPEDQRRYDECIVLAVKRSKPVGAEQWERFLPDVPVYQIPPCGNPRMFEKSMPTQAEMLAMLANSPLRRNLLASAGEEPIPRPPIPLGVGHTALLVASGQLDGIVRPPDEPPHVVRGTVRKKQFLSRVETKENEKSSSTTAIYSERITPIVRIVAQDGEILTLGDNTPDDTETPSDA